VRILCTNQALDRRGGTESYLETIAPELRALGHTVELFCLRGGPVADRLRARGFAVHEEAGTLAADYDAIHAHHASAALAVRARFPDVPLVFVAHSWFLELEIPPAEIAPGALVGLNDAVVERLRATLAGETVPVHRLTQPVTIRTDDTRVDVRHRPRRALALSRHLGTRLEPLRAACAGLGIELEQLGGVGRDVEDPETAIRNADLVLGSGRAILEAMALARAACVFDERGGAAWVTDATYPALEAVGFTARLGSGDDVDLPALLADYQRSYGVTARDLAVRNHAAPQHAAALVALYRDAAPRWSPAPPASLDRLAELTQEVFDLQHSLGIDRWERVRTEHRLRVLQDELDAIWNSASWRLTRPLRSLRRPPAVHPDRAPD
jgi:hypothetical protein